MPQKKPRRHFPFIVWVLSETLIRIYLLPKMTKENFRNAFVCFLFLCFIRRFSLKKRICFEVEFGKEGRFFGKFTYISSLTPQKLRFLKRLLFCSMLIDFFRVCVFMFHRWFSHRHSVPTSLWPGKLGHV